MAVSRRQARLVLAAALAAACALPAAAGAYPGANGPIVFAKGGTLTTITGGSETNLGITGNNPAWSADATKLAYDDGTSVYTAGADGSSPTAVPGATGTDPFWDPTGTKLVYVSSGDLYQSDLSGTPSALTSVGGISQPAWSPDGTRIAFTKDNDVQVLTLSSGAITDLTSSTADDSSPTWSPDGSQIAFVSNRDDSAGELYTMNADGSHQSRLSRSTAGATAPSWSPDGTKIAFTKSGDVWAVTLADDTLAEITTGGSDAQPDWASAFSISTPVVDAPDGTADGATLTALPVSYTGSAPPTAYGYAWERCNPAGSNCTAISGATTSSYTIQSIDVGSTIRVVVTATSAAGSASSTSDPTAVVTAAAPNNTVAPTITGGTSAAVGVALVASPGTWTGTTPISYSYQWERCDSGGSNCTDIGGATDMQYAPAGADVGSTLRVRVTANNGVGSPVTVESSQTVVVVSSAPANTSKPTIRGTAKVGFILIGSVGIWTGASPITYRFQWQRCPSSGNCQSVGGAVAASYTVTNADIGDKLRLVVTATNGAGSASAASDDTDPIGGTLPTSTIKPALSGVAEVGQTLIASTGGWVGSPTAFSYAWSRCKSNSCTTIPGATANSYRIQTADVGYQLMVTVTARNSAGTGTAGSLPTRSIVAGSGSGTPPASGRPVNTKQPRIAGAAVEGRTLVARVGTWGGTAPIAYAYQWQRCDAKRLLCSAIAKATRARYTLVAADKGKRVRVAVTGRNTLGTVIAYSAPTKLVKLPPKGKKLNGNAKANTLKGGAGNDVIRGRGGNDVLRGAAGNDRLYGNAGGDRIYGGAGSDHIYGGAGNDRLFGDGGYDRIYGGPGNDRISGGPGRNVIYGGPGNDAINALNGRRDLVDCGPGKDRVTADKADVVRHCEKVVRKTFVKKAPAGRSTTSATVRPANRLRSTVGRVRDGR